MGTHRTPRAAPTDPETHFAPADRADSKELLAGHRLCLEDPIVQVVLESLSGYVLVLNEQRQILAANEDVRAALERGNEACVIGLRPGELLNCLHFTQGPNGCGTSPHCRSCGAVLAILASQGQREPATDECRLSMMQGEKLAAVDFRVRATPIVVGDHKLIVFVLQDVSAQKRREVLEQVLLHDVANAITGIEGWSSIIGRNDPQEAAQQILALSNQLKGEIELHRALLRAEKNELTKRPIRLEAADVLRQTERFFVGHKLMKNRSLVMDPIRGPESFNGDPKLLQRILVNMVKNALEATAPGGTVRMRFAWERKRPGFYVHNSGAIPEEQRPHIFERSFSTRGPGRGIGTYSMKLFGENCLGGRVGFTTSDAQGTEFFVLLSEEDQEALPEDWPILKESERRFQSGVKLLLVDDEESHARLSTLLLQRLGYHVYACGSGAEAEQIFSRDPQSFAALLTDYRMPGMNGIELAQRIHTRRPDLPILLCTGIEEAAITPLAAGAGITRVTIKPTTREEFAHVLEEIGLRA